MKLSSCLLTLVLIPIFGGNELLAQLGGVIHFTNGEVAEGEITQATSSSFTWENFKSGQVATTAFSAISKVDFDPIDSWLEAEELFTQARYEEAAEAYLRVTQDLAESYYPVPGNFASLSLRKTMTCYRRLLDPKKVSEFSSRVAKELKTMPVDLQQFSPTELAWIEAGKGNWEGVIKIAETNQVLGVDATELSFLAGQGKLFGGKKLEALDYYTKAYSFGYGASPKVAKLSLRKSAEIVGTIEDEERKAELQSQLKIYKELFGAGNLWSGASASFIKLANQDLDTIDFKMGESELSKIPEDLPPISERDWIHPLEIERPLYVLGSRALKLPKAGSDDRPIRKGNDFIFDGNDSATGSALALNNTFLEAKIIFVSERDSSVIFAAGKLNKGMALFLNKGKLTFAWHTTKESRREFVLGTVSPTKEVVVHIQVNEGKVRGSLNFDGPLKMLGSIPKKTPLDEPYDFILAPNSKQDLVTDYKFPQFKGRVRFVGVGSGNDNAAIREMEKKMFKGKTVQISAK